MILTLTTSEEDRMRASMLAVAIITVAGTFASAAFAQAPTTGPQSTRFFNTLLEKDPSREVRMQMQLHQPGPGNPFHTHNGDQWEVVLEGEIVYIVRGQPPRVLKAGESVYIPRGTVHRNENKSGGPTRTIELLIVDKDKPQSNPAPAE
jgi:quercetin dioxygenase-like cupin family protein